MRKPFYEDAEELEDDVTIDEIGEDEEETEDYDNDDEDVSDDDCDDENNDEIDEYGSVEQTFDSSDILDTNLEIDEDIVSIATQLGEEAEADAAALSALVDDQAGPVMTAQYNKPFVSAPTDDGYETELLDEGQDGADIYDPSRDFFGDEDSDDGIEISDDDDEDVSDDDDDDDDDDTEIIE